LKAKKWYKKIHKPLESSKNKKIPVFDDPDFMISGNTSPNETIKYQIDRETQSGDVGYLTSKFRGSPNFENLTSQ